MARRQRGAMFTETLPLFVILVAVTHGGKDKPVSYILNFLAQHNVQTTYKLQYFFY